MPQQRAWKGHIHLAIAPTKMMERIEWMAEKATEIGFDELSFLNCQFSERKVVKTPRIDKIVISAVKQSHKAWKPVVNELVSFKENLQPSWKEYATQVKKNAAVLADDLIGRGFGIVSGGTDNHSMLVDLRI